MNRLTLCSMPCMTSHQLIVVYTTHVYYTAVIWIGSHCAVCPVWPRISWLSYILHTFITPGWYESAHIVQYALYDLSSADCRIYYTRLLHRGGMNRLTLCSMPCMTSHQLIVVYTTHVYYTAVIWIGSHCAVCPVWPLISWLSYILHTFITPRWYESAHIVQYALYDLASADCRIYTFITPRWYESAHIVQYALYDLSSADCRIYTFITPRWYESAHIVQYALYDLASADCRIYTFITPRWYESAHIVQYALYDLASADCRIYYTRLLHRGGMNRLTLCSMPCMTSHQLIVVYTTHVYYTGVVWIGSHCAVCPVWPRISWLSYILHTFITQGWYESAHIV